MDKLSIEELIKRLYEDYMPIGSEGLIKVLELSEFERGRLAGIASIIDGLERIVSDE